MNDRKEIRRLMVFLRPYSGLLFAGTLLMALMGMVEGLVAFAIRPALDLPVRVKKSTVRAKSASHEFWRGCAG